MRETPLSSTVMHLLTVFRGNQIAGEFKDGTEWKPNCMWLDGNHSDGLPTGGLKFNVPNYGELKSQASLDAGTECSSTIFTAAADPIEGNPEKRSIDPALAKRGIDIPLKPWMKATIVNSPNYVGHNATALCENPMTWGPDFIGSDGYHCDMSTRTVTPVCAVHDVQGCLHLDGNSLKRRSYVAKRQVHTDFKDYDHKQEW